MECLMIFRKRLTLVYTFVLGLLLFVNLIAEEKEKVSNEFSFGLIADCQYCDIEGQGVRKYSLSESKLKESVTQFNSMNLEFVAHLGDFIDRDFESFDVVVPIYNQLNVPKYHVLGNHDFSVLDNRKPEIHQILDMPSKYYDFEINGWRFIVLDGNDISFHAYPKTSEKYREAVEYYDTHGIDSPKWNGAIGRDQLKWLKTLLQEASRKRENVILFCHFPVYPANNHNLWNAGEIVALIETYSCVKAYINGHNHSGNYAVKEGIHYLTLKGMVDTEQTSYAVFKVDSSRLTVEGFGREEDRILSIRNQMD
jgi:predicted MPP superfamily phosphohydrolase